MGGPSVWPRRRGRLIVSRWRHCLLCALVALAAACSSGDDDSDAPREDADAETVDLGPLPDDIEAARAWAAEHEQRIDDFRLVASRLTGSELPADCEPVAADLEASLGSLEDHLNLVAASPDPVLGELLTSATVSTRMTIEACLSDQIDDADVERQGLRNALVMIERRQIALEEEA